MADFRSSTRVEVRSRRFAEGILQEITSEGIEMTRTSYEIVEDGKPEWQKCFKEIYENTFRDCVSVDGQIWSEVDDETTEFEPIDLEKKEFINGELTNQLHETIMEVAAKRKHCPPKYRSCLSRLTASELCQLGQLKVSCNPSTETLMKPDNMSEDVLDRLRDTEGSLSSVVKNAGKELIKAENLQTVAKITRKNSTKLYNHQDKPLKDINGQTVSPKKLRLSPRLHGVRKPRTRLKLL